MIFVDWRPFLLIALSLTLAALCVLLIWQVKRRPRWARILVWLTATPLLLSSSALTVFFIWIVLSQRQTVSQPIYSPNGKLAARVETWEGLFAGDDGTNVKVYSLHGLSSAWAYGGDEYSVEPGNIRWLDDHTLELRYTYDDEHTCDSPREIHVICLPIDVPGP
jgi:hypothetical protein